MELLLYCLCLVSWRCHAHLHHCIVKRAASNRLTCTCKISPSSYADVFSHPFPCSSLLLSPALVHSCYLAVSPLFTVRVITEASFFATMPNRSTLRILSALEFLVTAVSGKNSVRKH
ncbi:hypothetical protein J3F84DRAFT_391460 [Trichoderma pleuroticola]